MGMPNRLARAALRSAATESAGGGILADLDVGSCLESAAGPVGIPRDARGPVGAGFSLSTSLDSVLVGVPAAGTGEESPAMAGDDLVVSFIPCGRGLQMTHCPAFCVARDLEDRASTSLARKASLASRED